MLLLVSIDCKSIFFCFQDGCLYSLITDFIQNGICEPINGTVSIFGGDPNPFNWQTNSSCERQNAIVISKGVCSLKTEDLVATQDCNYEILEQRTFIQDTALFLLFSMCNTSNLINRRRNKAIRTSNRIIPIERVVEFENATISTNLNLGKFNRLISLFHFNLVLRRIRIKNLC